LPNLKWSSRNHNRNPKFFLVRLTEPFFRKVEPVNRFFSSVFAFSSLVFRLWFLCSLLHSGMFAQLGHYYMGWRWKKLEIYTLEWRVLGLNCVGVLSLCNTPSNKTKSREHIEFVKNCGVLDGQNYWRVCYRLALLVVCPFLPFPSLVPRFKNNCAN